MTETQKKILESLDLLILETIEKIRIFTKASDAMGTSTFQIQLEHLRLKREQFTRAFKDEK